jgi:catechol 2,3-dioxygenase-like lactoylglutathione lyase family enzyme
MPNISSVAMRVNNLDEMVAFYTEAFQVRFREVNTYGILSRFGEVDGITLKLVPIRESADFTGFPVHQLGFAVPDVEAVIALALQHGGRQEGEIIRNGGKIQAALRDPDGNTIELYSED